MPFNYKVGLQNVGSYQVAGRPFVSGSVNCNNEELILAPVAFPAVTNWVVIKNNDAGNTLKVGFSENGVDGTEPANRFFSLHYGASGSIRLDMKLSAIWISGSTDVDVIAGLTSIPVTEINNPGISPDGGNWSGSVGV